MTFGEKLQGLRQKAGLSQDGLAEQLGVSRQAVSRWERDETLPETATLLRIADLFQVSTDYLLRSSVKPAEPEKGDWMDRLAHLARTKGYLLGYLLILWGGLDLLGVLALRLLSQGMMDILLPSSFSDGGWTMRFSGMTNAALWLPALYGGVKILGGILTVHYGKRYGKKGKEDGQ